jgi:hypothetical protein
MLNFNRTGSEYRPDATCGDISREGYDGSFPGSMDRCGIPFGNEGDESAGSARASTFGVV